MASSILQIVKLYNHKQSEDPLFASLNPTSISALLPPKITSCSVSVWSAMDFVTKTFGGFSLSSSPFTQGAAIDLGEEGSRIWRIYEGTVKKDGQPCTLFVFDAASPAAHGRQPLADNMAKMLRKLRIPGLLKIIDSYEASSGSLTIATEPVRPVSTRLDEFSLTAKQWALQTVLATLENLHKHTKCAHCNIQLNSVFETANGEWVLGGFEIAGFLSSDTQPLWSYGSYLPENEANCPPEVQRQGWQAISAGGDRAAFAVDAWQYGRLVQTLLGKNMSPKVRSIVASLTASGKRSAIVDVAASASALDTPLVQIAEWTANPYALNEIEFDQLLQSLFRSIEDLSPSFIGGKIYPELAKAVQANKGGIDAVRLALALACRLDNKKFESVAMPLIVTLFSSMDRAIRLELMRAMPSFIEKVPDRAAQSQILPAMNPGFLDSEALIRQESLAAMRQLAPKLTKRQRNGDMLRMLAKTNSDPVPDIRAATITLLSDLVELMEDSTRSSVVVTAIARGLRDQALVVRKASLDGLLKTSRYFTPKETAEKLVGPAATALLDGSAEVRRVAQEVFDILLERIKQASAELGDATDRPSSAASEASVTSATSAPSISGMASVLNLWGSSPAATPPVVPVAPVQAAPIPVASPAVKVSQLMPEQSIVEESAVFNDTDWGWDAEPTEPVKPVKPNRNPRATRTLKPATQKPPATKQARAPTAPTAASLNLEPEDDTEGWDW